MKRFRTVIMVLCILSLIACSRGPARQTVNLDGAVKTLTSGGIFVYGKSSLPENAVVKGQLIELEGEKVYEEKKVSTDKDGSFTIEMKRPKLEHEYKLQVSFNPEDQEEQIKETFGDKGQYIKDDSEGFVENMEDTGVSGIVKYDQIFKMVTKGETRQLGQNSELNSSFEVIEME